jgi:hypothetical protein
LLEDKTLSTLELGDLLNQLKTAPKFLPHYYCLHVYLFFNGGILSLLSHKEYVSVSAETESVAIQNYDTLAGGLQSIATREIRSYNKTNELH